MLNYQSVPLVQFSAQPHEGRLQHPEPPNLGQSAKSPRVSCFSTSSFSNGLYNLVTNII